MRAKKQHQRSSKKFMIEEQKTDQRQCSKQTPYFPVFMNLEHKKIVVFGAGKVALRRILTLQFFHASIFVIAKEIKKEQKELFQELMTSGKIIFCQKAFTPSDLDEGADMVLAATDDSGVNLEIYDICKARGILVNTASDANRCDFYFPAVACTDEIVIGITGNGMNHKKVARMTEEIRRYLETIQHEDH